MIEVTRGMEWEMGHRVANHKSKCRNIHGHRYRLEVTIAGALVESAGDSSEGMVIDFGDFRRILTEGIHDVADHGFMVQENDQVMTEFFAANTAEAFKVVVVPFVPTVENLSRWCYEQLRKRLPEHVRLVRLRLFESPNSWADFVPPDAG